MDGLRRASSFLVLSLTVFLLSCFGKGNIGLVASTTVYTLSVSPQPSSVAVGSTVTFTATTNASAITWVLVGTGGTSTTPPTDAGSPTAQSGGKTFVYTAPAVPPVYGFNSGTAGTVTLRAIALTTTVEIPFTITAPSVTTGFYAPVSTSVALGSTTIINAYAVGSTNNAIALQVNGVTGGSTAAGTIAAPPSAIYGEYIYTAPAAMPMTGSTITLTAISQADPTKTSTLTLTLH